MRSKLIFVSFVCASALSLPSHAVFCPNNTATSRDDVNLTLRVFGTQNQRALLGAPVNIVAESWFADPTPPEDGEEQNKTLNLKVSNNTSVLADSTNSGVGGDRPAGIVFDGVYSDLALGMNTVIASSSSAANCNATSSFYIQEEPTASTTNFITRNIPANDLDGLEEITLSATYSVDQANSVKGGAPTLEWRIDGNTYNTNPVTVSLPKGNYTATFKVNDGTFSATDSTQVTITDVLAIPGGFNVETVCANNQSVVLAGWQSVSGISNYKVEYQEQFYGWQTISNTPYTFIEHYITNSNGSTDKIRVSACNADRCGPVRTSTFVDAGCSGGPAY